MHCIDGGLVLSAQYCRHCAGRNQADCGIRRLRSYTDGGDGIVGKVRRSYPRVGKDK
jgi:hypothetical protein